MEVLKELLDVEVREVLEAITWRKVRKEWDQEMKMNPKLEMLKRDVSLGEWSECARVVRRADRKLMMKLRGSMAGFQIETVRWRGVTRQERVCKKCDSGEMEDVDHWLMRCEAWNPNEDYWKPG